MPQIAFKPDWTRHAKAAPFRRNDRMLEVLPLGVIAFPGSGICANLADKAKKLGIPVCTFGRRGRRVTAPQAHTDELSLRSPHRTVPVGTAQGARRLQFCERKERASARK